MVRKAYSTNQRDRWYKPISVEVIGTLLIFSLFFAQSDPSTYLWPDNGDMSPSVQFLGYVKNWITFHTTCSTDIIFIELYLYHVHIL